MREPGNYLEEAIYEWFFQQGIGKGQEQTAGMAYQLAEFIVDHVHVDVNRPSPLRAAIESYQDLPPEDKRRFREAVKRRKGESE